MNILFLSKNGDGLGLVERVQSEGHNAHLHIINKSAQDVGSGMVEKPVFNKPLLTKDNRVVKENVKGLAKEVNADLIIFDTSGMGKIADYLRLLNYPILGGNWWADNATLNEEYGKKLMKQVGIATLPNKEVDGVDVSCELWWNGLSSHIHNMTFVDRQFMSGDVGPILDGGGGVVVKMVKPDMELVSEGIGKMERLLKRVSYRGPITLNSIVTEEKLYGVSLTVGFEYEALPSLFELHKGNITQLLYNIAVATSGYGVFTSDYAIAVRLSIPPYPNVGEVEVGVPIEGANENNFKHIWWKNIRVGERYESAGVRGELAAVVARGRSVGECRSRVYRTISNLTIPQMQYRNDVGARVNKDMGKLSEWGWL